MTKNIFLLFLLSALYFSCTKKDQLNSENQPLETKAVRRTATTATTETVSPTLYLDIDYSSSVLGMHVFIQWPNGTPPSNNTMYTMRFTTKGASNGGGQSVVELGVGADQLGVSFNETVTYNDPYSPITLSVKAELLKGLTVIASASQSVTTIPAVDASSAPDNSMATVTLNHTVGGGPYYDIIASFNNMGGYPERKFYFYAFYVPTDYERDYLEMKPYLLGKTTIQSSPTVTTQGAFSFYLPDGRDVSNIRVFLTKKEYPDSYFTDNVVKYPNMEPGYLMGQCLYDVTMYGIPLLGLNSTNVGRFPNSIQFYVGSLDPMLDMTIYYDKSFGYLLW